MDTSGLHSSTTSHAPPPHLIPHRAAFQAQFVSAIGAFVGCFAGLLLGGQDAAWTSLVLSFTAGGFIYIALVNIMPELLAHNSSFTQVLHTHPLHHSPPIPSLPLAPTHPASTHQPLTNHSLTTPQPLNQRVVRPGAAGGAGYLRGHRTNGPSSPLRMISSEGRSVAVD
jgi:hypothetical protein